jgi:transcriptional regulator GlxA family with amidase domain
VPVHRWLLAQRVDAARAALETGDASVEEVARATGFGTAANLRKHFRRRVATTPTAYRSAFGPPRASGRTNQIATSSNATPTGNAKIAAPL